MIDERDVREMLERRAEAISATPADEPKAIRRARRRLALNATVAGLVGVAVVAGGLAGLRVIRATPTPADRPTPPPPSGGKLAYALDGDIYVAEWDGSNAVRIADSRSVSECGGPGEYYADPMWSPDGRYLAYRQGYCPSRPENPSGVVISDPEGNVVAEAADITRAAWRISWSPDSTRLATWIGSDDIGGGIGVFGLDGAQHAVLSVPPEMNIPARDDPNIAAPVDTRWLPDGRSLLVPPDVVVPLDGSAPYTVPLDRRPAWVRYSPDGSRVAYAGADNLSPLLVAEADGSNPQVVFDGPVIVGTPDVVWSPAGDRIAFTSRNAGSGRGTVYELRVVDLATRTVTLLAEAYGDALLSVIDFSPEGDRILFSRPEGKGSLWSVDVDGTDPRRLVSGTWGDWQPPRPMP
jgi:Tol biopolymer transport system component